MQSQQFIKAKPFIKWVGGKGQLLTTLDEHLPANFSQLNDVTYIEPFVGGGAMLFHMLHKFYNIKRAVICDLNPNLIKTYNTIKKEPNVLIQKLQELQAQYSTLTEENQRKSFFLEIREKFNKGKLSRINTAVYFIFLNHTCFNGLYRVNSKGEFNVPFGKYKNPRFYNAETILADSSLLQKVDIIKADFSYIEKFVTKNTFIYFDPPYRPLDATSNFNSYAKEAFNDLEQIRLKSFFDKLTSKHCLMMLSNSDCRARNPEDTFFDDLYKTFIIERVWASRSINANSTKRGKLTELLIRNYSEIQIKSSIIQRQAHLDTTRNYGQSAFRKRV